LAEKDRLQSGATKRETLFMNTPAKQALLVLMLVSGGCNGTVTLIDGMAPEAAPSDTAAGDGTSDAPKDAPMTMDAADGGTPGSDASDAAEEANNEAGSTNDGGDQ
jgi:hypothetical protein